MSYQGDFAVGSVVDIDFPSQGLDGASITLGTDGTLRIYKNGSITQRTSLAGVTFTEDFDGITGWHHLTIVTSDNTDAGFYAAGGEYSIGVVTAVVDGTTVSAPLGSWSIERAGGALALLKSATFGLAVAKTALDLRASQASLDAVDDLLDTEMPALTTAVGLVKTKTDFLPSATAGAAGGLFIAGTNAATSVTTALTANITGSVGSVTGLTASDVGAIKAKTDNLPTDPADESLLEAAIAAVSGTPLVQLTGAGYIGDLDPGSTFDIRFETRKAGVLTTLAGSPVASVYKDNGATQSVAGLTLTVDFDGIAGHHNLRVATAAAGTFYSGGSNFTIVLTAGTVTGTSAIGLIGAFSHFARSALRPTTAGFTVDVAGDGSVTASGGLTVGSIADEVQTRTIAAVAAVNDKTGYALSSAGISAIWSAVTRELTGFGTLVAQVVAASGLTGPQAAQLTAIEGKTAPLPTDPADQSLLMAAIASSGATPVAIANEVQTRTIAAVTVVTGNVGGNVVGNVVGSVASVTAPVTAGTVSDKTGYALSSGAVLALWTALTSTLTGVGSIGKLIGDKLTSLTFSTPNVVDASGGGAGTAPTAAANASAVWDKLRADHVAVGSFGAGVIVADKSGFVLADPVGMKRATAFTGFPFPMELLDGSPGVGLAVVCQRSLDGGSTFGNCANTPFEGAGGWYRIDFATTDTDAPAVAFQFTAPGAKPRRFTVLTET